MLSEYSLQIGYDAYRDSFEAHLLLPKSDTKVIVNSTREPSKHLGVTELDKKVISETYKFIIDLDIGYLTSMPVPINPIIPELMGNKSEIRKQVNYYYVKIPKSEDFIRVDVRKSIVNFYRENGVSSDKLTLSYYFDGQPAFTPFYKNYELRPWQIKHRNLILNTVPLFSVETYLDRFYEYLDSREANLVNDCEHVFETLFSIQDLVMSETDMSITKLDLEDLFEAFDEYLTQEDKDYFLHLRENVEYPKNVNILVHYIVSLSKSSTNAQ